MKHVGDSFVAGDRLCEITFPIATIGIDAKQDGVMAKIITSQYETANADSIIALFATNQEHYMDYLHESMEDIQEIEKMAETVEIVEEANKKPDATVMMKVVRHMIQSGSIDGKSDFAKQLQSLARKGDAELLAAFEASCEGASYHQLRFDEAFFLDNATAIVEEHNALRK